MDSRYVTDWSSIIEGLRRQGLSFSHLEQCTGIARASLVRYRDGGTPKHPDGERILGFWCEFMNRQREHAPLTPRILNGNARQR